VDVEKAVAWYQKSLVSVERKLATPKLETAEMIQVQYA
jgi:hypothetical protein